MGRVVASQGAALPVGAHAAQIQAAAQSLLRSHAGAEMGVSISPDEIRIAYMLANHSIYVVAISIGAVFFGACSYVGNGPNFTIKSIAEGSGAKVPGFFGYIVRFTLPILLPIFLLIWIILFR